MAEVVSLGEENGGEASEKIVEKIQNRMEMDGILGRGNF